ncbi:transposase-like protein [Paraburkholderia sp. JPY465]
MFKVPHQAHTAEFKEAAVQRVKDGQGVSAVARELGMSMQTLRNWLKASEAGKLNGPGAKVVTAEQMELSCLRAENKRLQMELEIAKKRRDLCYESCLIDEGRPLDVVFQGFVQEGRLRGGRGSGRKSPVIYPTRAFMPYKARLKTGEPRKRAKPGYAVTNAHEYNESLKRRGQLSLYCPDGDLKALFINDTPYQKGVSGQSRTYSDAYLELIFIFYRVFGWGMWQITGHMHECVFHANRAAVPRQSEQAFHAKPSGDSTAKRALRTWRRGVSSFTPSRLRWSNHFGACASTRPIV